MVEVTFRFLNIQPCSLCSFDDGEVQVFKSLSNFFKKNLGWLCNTKIHKVISNLMSSQSCHVYVHFLLLILCLFILLLSSLCSNCHSCWCRSWGFQNFEGVQSLWRLFTSFCLEGESFLMEVYWNGWKVHYFSHPTK